MASARRDHTATLLPNGKVLVAGGETTGVVYLSSAALYDPETDTWSAAPAMARASSLHTATVLANGKVLVVGGYNGAYLKSAELYDPATNTWSAAGAMATSAFSVAKDSIFWLSLGSSGSGDLGLPEERRKGTPGETGRYTRRTPALAGREAGW
jgi:N-acetylneuraminic acid mutarotase